jgi:hypothetical protein
MIRVSKQAIIDKLKDIVEDIAEIQASIELVMYYSEFIAEKPEPKKRGRPLGVKNRVVEPEPVKRGRGRPLGTKNKEGHRAGRPPKTYSHNPAPTSPVSFYHIPKDLPVWLIAEPRDNFLGSAERYMFLDTRTGETVSTYFDNNNALGYRTGPYFEAYPIEGDANRWVREDEWEMYLAIIGELNRRYNTKNKPTEKLFNPMNKAGNL